MEARRGPREGEAFPDKEGNLSMRIDTGDEDIFDRWESQDKGPTNPWFITYLGIFALSPIRWFKSLVRDPFATEEDTTPKCRQLVERENSFRYFRGAKPDEKRDSADYDLFNNFDPCHYFIDQRDDEVAGMQQAIKLAIKPVTMQPPDVIAYSAVLTPADKHEGNVQQPLLDLGGSDGARHVVANRDKRGKQQSTYTGPNVLVVDKTPGPLLSPTQNKCGGVKALEADFNTISPDMAPDHLIVSIHAYTHFSKDMLEKISCRDAIHLAVNHDQALKDGYAKRIDEKTVAVNYDNKDWYEHYVPEQGDFLGGMRKSRLYQIITTVAPRSFHALKMNTNRSDGFAALGHTPPAGVLRYTIEGGPFTAPFALKADGIPKTLIIRRSTSLLLSKKQAETFTHSEPHYTDIQLRLDCEFFPGDDPCGAPDELYESFDARPPPHRHHTLVPHMVYLAGRAIGHKGMDAVREALLDYHLEGHNIQWKDSYDCLDKAYVAHHSLPRVTDGVMMRDPEIKVSKTSPRNLTATQKESKAFPDIDMVPCMKGSIAKDVPVHAAPRRVILRVSRQHHDCMLLKGGCDGADCKTGIFKIIHSSQMHSAPDATGRMQKETEMVTHVVYVGDHKTKENGEENSPYRSKPLLQPSLSKDHAPFFITDLLSPLTVKLLNPLGDERYEG